MNARGLIRYKIYIIWSKMGIVRGLKQFIRDLLNPKLMVMKITFFFIYGSAVILWPQLTPHQASLGLSKQHTGLFSTVMSVFTIIVPLAAGVTGDKIGNFKRIMSFVTFLCGVFALLFTVVPSASSDGATSNATINATTAEAGEQAVSVTFWSYMVVRVLFGCASSISFTMFDASVMAYTQHYGIDYGLQRVWGTVAVVVSALAGGYIVELTGGYDVLFYVSAGLHITTAAFMMALDTEFKVPAQSLTRTVLSLLLSPEPAMFFAALFAAGIFIGYFETFMYLYLASMGATPVLLGLTVTVGAPFEILLTLLASWVVSKIGHAPVIMLGLLAYAVRLLGFSFLTDPWWVLPLEVLESLANGVMFTAAIMYCTVLFPMDAIASFKGVFSVAYFGVGKLVGTMAGTALIGVLGEQATFRVLSAVALASAILYCVSYFAYKRHSSNTISVAGSGGDLPRQLRSARLEKPPMCQGVDNRAMVITDVD